VIDESDSQYEKQFDPRISIFLGIKIDSSDDDEDADDSIRFNCEFDSNVIDESDLQSEKHFEPRISTFCGINIDSSDDLQNVSDPISRNPNSRVTQITVRITKFYFHNSIRHDDTSEAIT
jgi:hypothetical protein